jgi:hypothetical protein
LRSRGHEHKQIDGATYYTERAMQDAFTAGKRLGVREGKKLGEMSKFELIDSLIIELQNMK